MSEVSVLPPSIDSEDPSEVLEVALGWVASGQLAHWEQVLPDDMLDRVLAYRKAKRCGAVREGQGCGLPADG